MPTDPRAWMYGRDQITGSSNDASLGSDTRKPRGAGNKKAKVFVRVDNDDAPGSTVGAKYGAWIKHKDTGASPTHELVGAYTKAVVGGQVKLKPEGDSPAVSPRVHASAFGGARAVQAMQLSRSWDDLSASAAANLQLGLQGESSLELPSNLPLGNTSLDLNVEVGAVVAAAATASATGFVGVRTPFSHRAKMGVHGAATAFAGATAGVKAAVDLNHVKLTGELKSLAGLGANVGAGLVFEQDADQQLKLTIEASAGASVGIGVSAAIKGQVNLQPGLDWLGQIEGSEVDLDVHPAIARMEHAWIGGQPTEIEMADFALIGDGEGVTSPSPATTSDVAQEIDPERAPRPGTGE